MKPFKALVLFFVVNIFVFKNYAQQKNETEKFAQLITQQKLKKILYKLTSDELQGRETASDGQKKAANYIQAYFKKLKLAPGNNKSYLQEFTVYQDSALDAKVVINQQAFALNKDFSVSIRMSKDEQINAQEILFAGYGIDEEKYSDYNNLDINGKVVLLIEGEPKLNDSTYLVSGNSNTSRWGTNINLKIRAAAKKGAKAILIINNGKTKHTEKGAMHLKMNTINNNSFPNTYTINNSMAEEILGVDSLKKLKENIAQGFALPTKLIATQLQLSFTKKEIACTSSNVLGYLKGTDKSEEVLVISAHYDHLGLKDDKLYRGADDDASGTTAIMALAEAFAKAKAANKTPKRSILFLAVSGEEKGLLGSYYYSKNPTYSLANTVVDLNIDMVGRIGYEYQKNTDSLNYVYIIGDDKLSSELRPINELANKNCCNLKLDYKYNDKKDPNQFYYRSDHYNFAVSKIPIIFYFNGVHEDYHQPTDTPEKINFSLLQKRAKLVFYTAWEIANRANKLVVDRNEE